MSEGALASEPSGIPKRPDLPRRAPLDSQLLDSQLVGSMLLLLDVDDTIVDTRGAMVVAGTAAAAALWPGRADVHTDWARRYYDDPAQWFRRYASGDVAFQTMRARRLEEASTAFDLVLPAEAHEAFEDAYAPAFRAAQRLFPDVLPLLDAADAVRLPVALLTNSSHAATVMKLGALSITGRFVAVVTTDTIGVGKPDPRVYAEACRRAGAAVGDSVCIGDSLEWDVLGAAAAGLRAIWLDRSGEGTPPDVARVRDLHEVRRALPTSAP